MCCAHAHIFPQVQGRVGAGPTKGLGYGRMQVGSEVIQLMPAHNEETVYSDEMLLANMDWAGLSGRCCCRGLFMARAMNMRKMRPGAIQIACRRWRIWIRGARICERSGRARLILRRSKWSAR